MNPDELKAQSSVNLLRMFALILAELRSRDLVRSTNNPVADLAERVAAHALRLTLVGRSNAGHDGVDADGKRYQIKSRRITRHNKSRQMGFIRNLSNRPFDHLIGILFDEQFRIVRACGLPFDLVNERAVFVKHVNAHRIHLRDSIWDEPRSRDLTDEMRAAAIVLGCGLSIADVESIASSPMRSSQYTR